MKVRILAEQQTHPSQSDRRYLASGEEVDLPSAWAKELLNRGEAEPLTVQRNGGGKTQETR